MLYFKRIKLSLFLRVIIAIICGSLLGLVAPDVLVRIFKTFDVLFSQCLKFIIPLLVLGLVTPAIAGVGRRAGKMLLSVLAIAYLSTILSGFFAYVCSSNTLPMYLQVGEFYSETVSGKEFLPYFEIKIPPVCDIMTALLLSFMIGVGIILTDSKALKTGFDEFGSIVKLTIEKAIIPLLPVYIFTMICEMSAKGTIAALIGAGFKIILSKLVFLIRNCFCSLTNSSKSSDKLGYFSRKIVMALSISFLAKTGLILLTLLSTSLPMP